MWYLKYSNCSKKISYPCSERSDTVYRSVLGDQRYVSAEQGWMEMNLRAEDMQIKLLGVEILLHCLSATSHALSCPCAAVQLACPSFCSSRLIPTPVPLQLLCLLLGRIFHNHMAASLSSSELHLTLHLFREVLTDHPV